MKKILEVKNFYIIIFIFSLISLLIALYIEFILGHKPCKLCTYQRIPYLISIFITFLGISYYKKNIWMYGLLITFFLSALISGYHFGIEQNIFNDFSGCTKDNINIINKEEIIKSFNKDVLSCKNTNFKFFGLSLASINFLFSLIICILTVKIISNEKNKKK